MLLTLNGAQLFQRVTNMVDGTEACLLGPGDVLRVVIPIEGYGRSIIHIGAEILEGTDVEVVRRPRTLQMVRDFEATPTDLHWLYIHYLLPESPPDESWAFEETIDWFAMKSSPDPMPRANPRLIVPTDAQIVPHPWEREPS